MNGHHGKRQGEDLRARLLAKVWDQWPAASRDDTELGEVVAYYAQRTPEERDRIDAAVQIWLKCPGWTEQGGRFVKGLLKWLRSGKWRGDPPVERPTGNKVAMTPEVRAQNEAALRASGVPKGYVAAMIGPDRVYISEPDAEGLVRHVFPREQKVEIHHYGGPTGDYRLIRTEEGCDAWAITAYAQEKR